MAYALAASDAGPRRDSLTFSGRIATLTTVLVTGSRGSATTSVPPSLVAISQAVMLARSDLAVEQIDVADELGDPARTRRLVELARGRDLFEPAGVHHADPVRHRHRLLLVVGDDDEGHAEAALQVHQFELRALAQLLVERGQRLVEQQHLRPARQRARQRHALLLAAGELIRLALLHAVELDQRHHLGDAGGDIARAMPARFRPKAMLSRTERCGNSA